MGREINRVPLTFAFPIGESYADTMWLHHKATCPNANDEEFDHDDETCGGYPRRPPKGEGWQLWQTVSDGPISPVFKTPEELIDWMSQPVPPDERPSYRPEAFPDHPWDRGWRRETAERFVRGPGWMPSGLALDGRMLTTDEVVNIVKKTDV